MQNLTPQQRQAMQRKAERERAAGVLNIHTAALLIQAAINDGYTYHEAERAIIDSAHERELVIMRNLPRGAWMR